MLKKLINLLKPNSKLKECDQHIQRHLKNVLANEYCHQCDSQMCYMCSNRHSEAGHIINVSENITISDQTVQPTTDIFQDPNNILKKFNLGYLVSFDWQSAICPCGTLLDKHDKSGICVACGTATCSTKCHTEYLQQTDLCTFHKNFNQHDENTSMRSILLKNIKYLQGMGLGRGSPINKTSQHFIMGFLSQNTNQIYLQRGFRQYGNPLKQTLNYMNIVIGGQIDHENNLFRICECLCQGCSDRGFHSVINCQHTCKTDYMLRIRDLLSDQSIYDSCQCNCDFCKSGITLFQHKKIDCMRLCYRSPIRQIT